MYKFRDITQVVEASESVLPSEALMINGEYIENLIPGYRTLNVAGRESLSPEIETFTTGVRDGSTKLSRRYPERIITITYQLVAKTNEAFREAFNTLAKVLNVEDAELIFNDEQDKYFIGTPYTIEEVEPGRKAVTGKFEILCVDPFKYSVYEYEAEADLVDNTILVDYNGSHKSFPILQANFYKEDESSEDGETVQQISGAGDCGFVGFFAENEKIIQVGDPNEVDGEENAFPASQTLILNDFDNANAWGTAAKSLWALNNGVVFPSSNKQMGNVAILSSPHQQRALSAGSKTTTVLKNAKSTSSEPIFYYSITARAFSRKERQVTLSFAVTAKMAKSSNFFGKGYILKGSLCVAGEWHDFTFKNSSERWEGNSGHTVTVKVTLGNIVPSTSSVSVKFRAFRGDNLGTAGILDTVSCAPAQIPVVIISSNNYYLAASSYGSANGCWHGASISRDIPADKTGIVGATNFRLSYTHLMCIGDSDSASKPSNQLGAFQVQITDSENNQVAGIRIEKNTSGTKADLIFSAKNFTKTYTKAVDVTYKNNYLTISNKNNVQHCGIDKNGNTITFKCAGKEFAWKNDELQNVIATKVTFSFEQYAGHIALSYNGVSRISFSKNNCETYKDVPNKFGSGDVLEVDCGSGEIFLNGILKPELGALGNDWETFYLKPGLNQIGIAYSDWVQEGFEPTFKVRYREVYI